MQEKCLIAIKQARQDHLDWVRRAKMLVEGLPVKEDSIPISTSECAFGRWFDANIKKFLVLKHFHKVIDDIEEVHHALHKEYEFIYNVSFKKEENGFLSKIFSKEKSMPSETLEMLKGHLASLLVISEKLTKLLDTFSIQVRQLDQESIDKINT